MWSIKLLLLVGSRQTRCQRKDYERTHSISLTTWLGPNRILDGTNYRKPTVLIHNDNCKEGCPRLEASIKCLTSSYFWTAEGLRYGHPVKLIVIRYHHMFRRRNSEEHLASKIMHVACKPSNRITWWLQIHRPNQVVQFDVRCPSPSQWDTPLICCETSSPAWTPSRPGASSWTPPAGTVWSWCAVHAPSCPSDARTCNNGAKYNLYK